MSIPGLQASVTIPSSGLHALLRDFFAPKVKRFRRMIGARNPSLRHRPTDRWATGLIRQQHPAGRANHFNGLLDTEARHPRLRRESEDALP